ncbi:MAG: Type 1 glutamine amidotransferase-like domain-containing protein [bacterium]
MKLFLASLAHVTLDLVLPLLPDQPQKLKLAYIATAADPYDSDKRSWADDNHAKLVSMGFRISPYGLKGKDQGQLLRDLSSFHVIFVEGGNCFYLLDWMRKSGFDIVIKQLLDRGVVYIGSSAGSIVMGPDIEYAKSLDIPSPQLGNFAGLGLINSLIIPHYGREKYALRHATTIKDLASQHSPYPIQPLADNQVIIINGEKQELQTLR